MRAVVQRVSRAEVRVGHEVVGAIGHGACVLLGVAPGDTDLTATHLADRIAALRIFDDDSERMNRSLEQVGGEALVVSQFTLQADTSRGHRPSFMGAAPAEPAKCRYTVFADRLRQLGLVVATGRFAARMDVELVNSGPVTIVLTSGEDDWRADAG